ncbi:hypothetical protein GCM10027614_43410 [Micromonospora vulcania]
MPESRTIVRLTVEVHNGGQAALPVAPSSRQLTLLYGPQLTEAAAVTGHKYPDPAEQTKKGLSADGDTRIPVGGKSRFVESQTVPMDAVDDLTVVVELPSIFGTRTPYTLTGVQRLVKLVR